ncbi:Hypothetical_protein [Hexamita inflata]|uniref:Hypothetical_protein n=1 Tax=Hexamita inflata TaxID=28002 RepID=A0AA86NGI1_9EUKA|nr:Hypothetical protein HINF_LOCUS6880 [Hexamita inflata]
MSSKHRIIKQHYYKKDNISMPSFAAKTTQETMNNSFVKSDGDNISIQQYKKQNYNQLVFKQSEIDLQLEESNDNAFTDNLNLINQNIKCYQLIFNIRTNIQKTSDYTSRVRKIETTQAENQSLVSKMLLNHEIYQQLVIKYFYMSK